MNSMILVLISEYQWVPHCYLGNSISQNYWYLTFPIIHTNIENNHICVNKSFKFNGKLLLYKVI